MLAMLHGIECHGDVVDPVGTDVDEVDVVPLTKLFVGFSVAGILGCPGESPGFKGLLGPLDILRKHVAKSHDLDSGNISEAGDRSGASHSETDESDSDGFHRGNSQTDDIFLSGGTGGSVDLDRADGGLI